jgi:hypothetical protein
MEGKLVKCVGFADARLPFRWFGRYWGPNIQQHWKYSLTTCHTSIGLGNFDAIEGGLITTIAMHICSTLAA